MEYVVSARVGLNDMKALVNLDQERREKVIPLLNVRGESSRHLDGFLQHWTDHRFFLDVSPYPADINSAFVFEKALLDPTDAYAKRRAFYTQVQGTSNHIIPVISQASSGPARNAIQLALALERNFGQVAVRANLSGHDAAEQGIRLVNVLNALGEPGRVWVLLDCGAISQANDLANSVVLVSILQAIRDLPLAGTAIVTTSFPDSKPANGTTRTIACLDLVAQTRMNICPFATPLTYGDYAATNPSGAIEYVHGMQVIPFASYFLRVNGGKRDKVGIRSFQLMSI